MKNMLFPARSRRSRRLRGPALAVVTMLAAAYRAERFDAKRRA